MRVGGSRVKGRRGGEAEMGIEWIRALWCKTLITISSTSVNSIKMQISVCVCQHHFAAFRCPSKISP